MIDRCRVPKKKKKKNDQDNAQEQGGIESNTTFYVHTLQFFLWFIYYVK